MLNCCTIGRECKIIHFERLYPIISFQLTIRPGNSIWKKTKIQSPNSNLKGIFKVEIQTMVRTNSVRMAKKPTNQYLIQNFIAERRIIKTIKPNHHDSYWAPAARHHQIKLQTTTTNYRQLKKILKKNETCLFTGS